MLRLTPLLAALLLATACDGTGTPPPEEGRVMIRDGMRVMQVTRGDIVDIVPAVGEIQAAAAVEVGAEVSGSIAAVDVDFDEPVEEGQRLALIDPAPFEAALNQSRAQLVIAEAERDTASANLASLRAQLARAEELAGRGAGAASTREDLRYQVQAAQATVARATAGVTLAEARVADAEFDLSRTEIRAPIDGFVLERRVEAGQVINAAQTAPVLFIIAANLNEVVIEARVAENDVGRITEDMEVRFTVDAYPGEYFTGRSGPVRRAPRRAGRFVSYPVMIEASDPQERLLPGMTASVEFVHHDARNVLRAPVESLYFRPSDYAPELPEDVVAAAEARGVLSRFDSPQQRRTMLANIEIGLLIARDRSRVFVLDSSGRPQRREIAIGIEDADFFEIAEGDVEEGDLIVMGLDDGLGP
ncbi:efflux RND transporter periplasmic adaptor subunit [Hyphobacterium marinum]|uniref:Efflux RND transporter periplasmic adaptor subunit n=1 Tax=Hyphobacterium marinum TaxID=3116574 RepID=A0ABU7LXL7_9PROT|nr:efflux RND transporter periplasmic adaptor subunit [Hyphobacterium sp. Y6023]MEE2566309.1 efflux RND transporter periplasmic adaptor subunit [Hyphobacterium sp. Y6023]